MMLRKIRLAVMTLVTTTLVGGCSYEYQVEMGVKKDGIETSVSTNAPLMPVEKAHLSKVFGEPQAEQKNKRRTAYPSKLMSGIWDNGFGGKAMLDEYESPLGKAHVYMNMMGGDVRLYEDQKVMHECLDMLLDMVTEQIRTKAENKSIAGKMIKLADGPLRSDLHDILSVAVGFNMAAKIAHRIDSENSKDSGMKDKVQEQLTATFIALLYQRGWINEREAGMMASGTWASPFAEGALTIAFFRAIDMPMSKENMDEIGKNMSSILNEEFGDKLRLALIAKCEGHPHLEVAINHASEMLTSYSYDQSLQTGDWGKPTLTLGSWNETTSTVSWSNDVSPWSIGLLSVPTTHFAIWVSPDKDSGKQYFDKPLTNEQLANFCVVWANASKAQQDDAMELMTSKTTNKKSLLMKVMSTLIEPTSDSKKD